MFSVRLACCDVVCWFCFCSKMRWQTARTWAQRALTASARPSPMRTQEPSYPLRCMKMWRRTAELRQRCTTPKMEEIGQYRLEPQSYAQRQFWLFCLYFLVILSCGETLASSLNDFRDTSSIVIHLSSEPDLRCHHNARHNHSWRMQSSL